MSDHSGVEMLCDECFRRRYGDTYAYAYTYADYYYVDSSPKVTAIYFPLNSVRWWSMNVNCTRDLFVPTLYKNIISRPKL